MSIAIAIAIVRGSLLSIAIAIAIVPKMGNSNSFSIAIAHILVPFVLQATLQNRGFQGLKYIVKQRMAMMSFSVESVPLVNLANGQSALCTPNLSKVPYVVMTDSPLA